MGRLIVDLVIGRLLVPGVGAGHADKQRECGYHQEQPPHLKSPLLEDVQMNSAWRENRLEVHQS
jgi:hypothetical protein